MKSKMRELKVLLLSSAGNRHVMAAKPFLDLRLKEQNDIGRLNAMIDQARESSCLGASGLTTVRVRWRRW